MGGLRYRSPFGSHHLSDFRRKDCPPRAAWPQIAHFKWNPLLLEKMKQRKSTGAEGEMFWLHESGRMLEYLRRNKWRINTDAECFAMPQSWSSPFGYVDNHAELSRYPKLCNEHEGKLVQSSGARRKK